MREIDPRIRELHNNAPLIDLHCHPPLKLFLLPEKKLHQAHDVTDEDDPFSFRVDLPSLIQGGVRAAFATTHVPEHPLLKDCFLIRGMAAMNSPLAKALSAPPDRVTREMITNFETAVESANAAGFRATICRSYEELRAVLKTDAVCFVHAIEGGHSLRGDRSVLENLQDYFDRGVSLITLAHFYDNTISPPVPGIPNDNCLAKAGCFKRALRADPELGLHPGGRDSARFMLEQGMLIDLIHSTRKARYDIYKLWADTPAHFRRPLIISHAGVYEMAPHEMNPTLDELEILRRTGGVIGIIAMNYWLFGKTLKGPADTFEHVVRTIDLLADHGFEDQIAIGSDFDGFTNPPRGLQEPSEFPNLTDELLARRRFPGRPYTADQVMKFLGGNTLRVLEAGWGRRGPQNDPHRSLRAVEISPPGAGTQEYLRALGCWVPSHSEPRSALANERTQPVRALDPAALEEIRLELRRDPALWLSHPPHLLGPQPTLSQIDRLIDEVQSRLAEPERAMTELRAVRAVGESHYDLPEECRFPGYDVDDPGIVMSRSDMQDSDWGGWATSWLSSVWYRMAHRKPNLPLHDPAGTNFCYPLRENANVATLGLFSDWGTGYYHSRYIARHLSDLSPGQIVHLGDVYYAGSPKELGDYAGGVLAPLLERLPVHLMNANHEMMHHGIPLLELIAEKQRRHPAQQPQESTYFCLYNDHYQVVAIDTDFHGGGRFRSVELQAWLAQRLIEGRASGKVNILLTQHEAFLSGKNVSALLGDDLKKLVLEQQLVDLWFWGDEHGAALYHPGPKAPFIGALIGHGGYPFSLRKREWATPDPEIARVAWVETAPRFPNHSGSTARQDVGNNGFVWLSLEPTGIELKFVDWRRQLRYHTRIIRDHSRQGRLYLPDTPIFEGPSTGTCGKPV
jgi:microsomal dipeptidase-like Zn-dependent dipeptidase